MGQKREPILSVELLNEQFRFTFLSIWRGWKRALVFNYLQYLDTPKTIYNKEASITFILHTFTFFQKLYKEIVSTRGI